MRSRWNHLRRFRTSNRVQLRGIWRPTLTGLGSLPRDVPPLATNTIGGLRIFTDADVRELERRRAKQGNRCDAVS